MTIGSADGQAYQDEMDLHLDRPIPTSEMSALSPRSGAQQWQDAIAKNQQTQQTKPSMGEQVLDIAGKTGETLWNALPPVMGAKWMEKHSTDVPGQTDPTEATQGAANVALGLAGGGTSFASKGSLGVFGGPIGASISLTPGRRIAEAMEQAGRSRENIFDTTGWWRGSSDKKWMFEINDNALKAKPLIQVAHPDNGIEGQLKNFIEHDKLFESYPHLQNMKVRINPQYSPNEKEGVTHLWDDNGGLLKEPWIELGGKVNAKGLSEDQKSVLLHELNHTIQEVEGFAPGGGPAWTREAVLKNLLGKARNLKPGTEDHEKVLNAISWLTKGMNPKQAEGAARELGYEMYKNLPGEVTSRNVQTRYETRNVIGNKNFNAHESARYPWKTEDVPPEQQFDYIGAAGGRSNAFSEVVPMRRAANDNKNLQLPDSIGIDAMWNKFVKDQKVKDFKDKFKIVPKEPEK